MSNEFKGTPGSWELGVPEIQGNGLHVPIHAESHGELAMVVWQMEDDRHDGTPSVECEANARLIAAAPRLYAALARLTQAAQDANVGYLDAAVAEGWDALELATSNSN